jgi:PRTRC genetic system protein A
MNNRFVDYTIAHDDSELPPVTDKLYEYVMGQDGLYLRAKRPGIEICTHVSPSSVQLRGLAEVQSGFRFDFPKVPAPLLRMMLVMSKAARDCKDRPIERLFYLHRDPDQQFAQSDQWRVVVPQQIATSHAVRPAQTGAGSWTENAVIELHSHHEMRAFFSTQDDLDECQGFRIYAVIGEIFSRPVIRVRAGVLVTLYRCRPNRCSCCLRK